MPYPSAIKIIDPEVPATGKGRLMDAARLGKLIPFNAHAPMAPPRPFPEEKREVWLKLNETRNACTPRRGISPGQRPGRVPQACWFCLMVAITAASITVVISCAVVILFMVGALISWGVSRWSPVKPLADFALDATLSLAAMASLVAAAGVVVARRSGWVKTVSVPVPDSHPWHTSNAASVYHRHYVTSGDLDADAELVWARAADAADKIRQSEAVQSRLIDSVQITIVLPYRLWEIAERLARLSAVVSIRSTRGIMHPTLPLTCTSFPALHGITEYLPAVRSEHQAILSGVETDDPDVAVVLNPQRRVHALAAADIEERVRNLEVFADRAGEADAARQRERAMRKLADLNPSHHELLAHLGHTGNDLGMSANVSQEVQAVIDQANEAIRKANEAGRSLVLPDEADT